MVVGGEMLQERSLEQSDEPISLSFFTEWYSDMLKKTFVVLKAFLELMKALLRALLALN